MTSLFKTLKYNFYYNREYFIKEDLISQLKQSVEDINLEFKNQNKEFLEQTENTTTLCTILEAIFLHGLKDSLIWQNLSIILNNEIERIPEPNFWPLLLIFLHSQTIEQIEKLSQIKNDIGNCRAWIRLTLNESLFSSYLKIIKKNCSALNPYYKSYALLKDSNQLDLACCILERLEAYVQIILPINSSLLNKWSTLPLQLSGLYTPPLHSSSIATGIDVASSLEDSDSIPIPKPLQTNEVFSDSISNSPFNRNITIVPKNINEVKETDETECEEENVKLFLEKIQNIDQLNVNESDIIGKDNMNLNSCDNSHNQNHKNDYHGHGWSDDFSSENDTKEINTSNLQSRNENKTENNLIFSQKLSRSTSANSVSSLTSPYNKYSYDALLIKHKDIRDLEDRHDELQRFANNFDLTGEIIKDIIENDKCDDSPKDSSYEDTNSCNNSNQLTLDEDNCGFEILPKLANEKFTLKESHEMEEHIYKLAREYGLDAQGYICKGCAHPLGIGFANAHVCSFSGHYFCEQCMSSEQFVIPAKIIFNWDFRKYNVSKRTATFLTDFQHILFIDFAIYNPKIYEASEEMAMLQSLRIKLNFIRAYFYNCCESSIQALKTQINSKEYLYKKIHQYSIADLLMIPKGRLLRKLQKTYQFGEEHILNCGLCSVKGYICELCEGHNILYPFHIEKTFRCELCSSVFHDYCLDQTKPCPKCRRKRERKNLPLLEAVHLL